MDSLRCVSYTLHGLLIILDFALSYLHTYKLFSVLSFHILGSVVADIGIKRVLFVVMATILRLHSMQSAKLLQ